MVLPGSVAGPKNFSAGAVNGWEYGAFDGIKNT
jgi:hypothetical protein